MILGINPFFDDYYCFHNYKYQPIGVLSVLATLRSAGYEVAFLDAQTKRRQQTRKPKELENTEGGYYRYGMGDREYKAALMEYAEPQVILMTSSMTFRWHSLRDTIALTKEVFPINNKLYPGTVSRKDFGKLKAFIDAIHYLKKGGLDLVSGMDEFTQSARSMLIPKRKEYLTTTQVARYLGIDASTVRRHVKQGNLIPAKRVGNRAYFEKSQIEKELPF